MRFSDDVKPTLPEIQDAKSFVAQAHGRVARGRGQVGQIAKQGGSPRVRVRLATSAT